MTKMTKFKAGDIANHPWSDDPVVLISGFTDISDSEPNPKYWEILIGGELELVLENELEALNG